MAKEKSAKELSEILSMQLDALGKEGVTASDIKVSEAIANVIGKQLKLAALEMNYAKVKNVAAGNIPSLNR